MKWTALEYLHSRFKVFSLGDMILDMSILSNGRNALSAIVVAKALGISYQANWKRWWSDCASDRCYCDPAGEPNIYDSRVASADYHCWCLMLVGREVYKEIDNRSNWHGNKS